MSPTPRRGARCGAARRVLTAALVASLYGAALAVKNVTMTLPEAVAQGDAVTLRCDYDLDGQTLYSIKWFRGESEFYQYVPKEIPPTKVFNVDGVKIDVDMSRSDANRVMVRDVAWQPPSYYRCEVSADAPTFHTGVQTGLLTVIVPPQKPPTLTVDKKRFNTGDMIRANCTVPAAYPAPNITWLLDDTPLSNQVEFYTESLQHEPAASRHGPGHGPGHGLGHGAQAAEEVRLDSVRSAVQITADRNKMVLSCQASQYAVYRQQSAPVVLQSEGAPKPAPVRKAASSGARGGHGLRPLASLLLLPLSLLAALAVPALGGARR